MPSPPGRPSAALKLIPKPTGSPSPPAKPSRGKIFYNATRSPATIDLGNRQYLDLDQNPVVGSLTLSPFTSKILIDNGPAPLTLLSINPALSAVGSSRRSR